ncbi:MAG: response regulator transcription factor, partial [Candidatus Eremiobacterota bacterium]
MRALVVEDDPVVAEVVTRLLNLEAFQVICVASVQAAVAACRESLPDLVVLERVLPDGDGLLVCRTLRTLAPRIPILILSNRVDTIDKVLGLELGADDYLGKPFDLEELRLRVHALLRRSRTCYPGASGL